MLKAITRSLSCKEVTRLNSERLDRPLAAHERLLTRIHMLYCNSCRNVARQFAFLRQAMLAYRSGAGFRPKK